MTREEIITLIKKELSVAVEVNYNSYSDSLKVKVKLYLDGEVISSDEDSVSIGSDR